MAETVDVLAVMAHPDDAELLCGGSLAACVDRGERVGVLSLTEGEKGTWGSAELRAQEAAKAADILGIHARTSVKLPDAAIMNTQEARQVVVEQLRAFRPRVVVTHWTAGRHPDHRIAAELVTDACFLAGLSRFPAEGKPYRPFKVVYATAFREDADPPTFVMDISEQMERKLKAIAAFHSQVEGKTQLGEVYAGGTRPLLDQVRATCARYGALARVEYAEPFRTRETMLVESLARLPVSTF